MENDVEEKRCLKISGFVNFWRCLGNLIEKISRPRIYCFFASLTLQRIPRDSMSLLQKPSQVEGPSSTIPIVSVVWRILNNRRRLLHTIACCIISRVLGRGPTELGTVRGNSCQASSVERARYSAAMSRCWQTKVSAKYCQCLALKTNTVIILDEK